MYLSIVPVEAVVVDGNNTLTFVMLLKMLIQTTTELYRSFRF